MRCLYPRTVGFLADGKTISWSPKHYSPEYAKFQLPCGKCIECRLEYARSWAVRCTHEAKMHENNAFITLTYSDENLKSPKLQYIDFQLFIKRLRKQIYTKFVEDYGPTAWKQLLEPERKKIYESARISTFVTGEYGDLRKRPHWHALIFNWCPSDLKYKYKNDNGDIVSSSATLDNLWNLGITEVGTVTFQSAGYVARYAAKKLVHGKDGHDYEPISKKSQKNAIGKKFLEKYWPDIFNYGHIILENGQKTTIPRYYEKWLQKNQPEAWIEYTTKLKAERAATAQKKVLEELIETIKTTETRGIHKGQEITKAQTQKIIIDQKFKTLQSYLKGDI